MLRKHFVNEPDDGMGALERSCEEYRQRALTAEDKLAKMGLELRKLLAAIDDALERK